MRSVAPIWPAHPAELLWQPRETGRCEARDAVSDRNGGDAALIPRRSCRIPWLTCVWDVRALLGLCRSLLPLAFDLEKSSDMVGARRMAQPRRAHPTSKLALVAYWYGPAVCVAQNILAQSGIFRW